MMYGSEKTIHTLDRGGSTLSTFKKFRNGEAEKALRQYRIRVKVTSAEDEMTEFLKFTNEIAGYRDNHTLTLDKEDNGTRPAFIIDYPAKNLDGSWFIIKNYCLIDFTE